MRIEQYATTLSGGNGSDIELHSTINGRTLVSTERYYYDSANRATRIIRQDADNDTYECRWEYDHNNNVTNLVEIVNGQAHTSAYTYDLEQPISQFVNDGVTWSYTYDANGLRTGRSDGTNTYQYIYAGDKLVRMIYNGEVVDISYAGSQPLSLTYDGATYYYVLNGQGDVIGLTDSTGTMAIGYTYGAYGTIMALAADENLAPVLVQMNPLTYRGYVYDREIKFFYLQSRYYDPELGRFINADALVSTGQGVLGNNMYTYCLNHPVRYRDSLGVAAEEATDTDDSDNDEKDPGTRVVGAGIQFDLDVGMSTAGYEIILFWDPTVCGEGNWKVAVYNYNGICVSADDPFIQTVIACLMANAECFNLQDIENDCVDKASAFLQVVLASLSMDHSIGVSGVVVIGNSQFDGTEDYTEAFTSVNYSWDRFRGSYAYADTCRAITFGRNITGRSLLPSRSISQTYYYLQNEITFVAPF